MIATIYEILSLKYFIYPKCHSVRFFGCQWKNYSSGRKKFSCNRKYSKYLNFYDKDIIYIFSLSQVVYLLHHDIFFVVPVTGTLFPVTRNIHSFTGNFFCDTRRSFLSLSQEINFLSQEIFFLSQEKILLRQILYSYSFCHRKYDIGIFHHLTEMFLL